MNNRFVLNFFSSYIAPPNINNGPEVRMSELKKIRILKLQDRYKISCAVSSGLYGMCM